MHLRRCEGASYKLCSLTCPPKHIAGRRKSRAQLWCLQNSLNGPPVDDEFRSRYQSGMPEQKPQNHKQQLTVSMQQRTTSRIAGTTIAVQMLDVHPGENTSAMSPHAPPPPYLPIHLPPPGLCMGNKNAGRRTSLLLRPQRLQPSLRLHRPRLLLQLLPLSII